MAQEILVSINIQSEKANAALVKNTQKFRENKKTIDALASAKQKLAKLQTQEAVDLEIANQQIRIQKALNEAAAKSTLGLANAKERETAVDKQLRRAEEKLAFLRSDEALKLQRINEQIKIQNNLNAALIKSEMGLATTKASLNAQGKQFRTQSGLNNAILLEAGRLASDASFGFTAIANNLSQIVSLGTSFVNTTGSFKTAMKELGQSLLGTGGVLIAVQLLISFLPKIIKFFTKASDEAKKFEEEMRNATKAIDDQIDVFERLSREYSQYGTSTSSLREQVSLLKEESNDFAKALESLEERDFKLVDEAGVFEGEAAIQRLVFQFSQYQKVLREEELNKFNIKTLNEELRKDDLSLEEREEKQEQLNTADAKYIELLKERIRLREILFEKPFDFSELEVDLDIADDEKIALSNLFFVDSDEDKEFQKMLNDVPEYIDDVDEVVNEYVLRKGKESLLKRIFKLEPASLEKDLKELRESTEKFGDESLFLTEEYARAEQAIRNKWNEIERQGKAKHYQILLNQISSFLNSSAQLNEENKALARAAIIANSASASIGIWDSYFTKDKTNTPATLRLAATIATQAALVASTIQALKQLNSNTLSGAGATTSAPVTAPAFNVVGASPVDQLAELVGGALSPEGGLNFNVNANVNPIDLDLVSDQFNSDESQAGIGG